MANSLVLPRVRYCRSPFPLHFLSPRLRLIYSPRSSQAFIHQAAAAASAVEPQEFIIPPIFDIFDVPSRLGQSTSFIRSTTSSPRVSADKDVPKNIDSSLSRPPPSVLPPPITFDGPARPRNLPLLSFQKRVNEVLKPKHTSLRQIREHHAPSLPRSTSESLVEVFDGPARLRRYSHKTSRPYRDGQRILLLGLAGAIAGTALSYTTTFP